MPVLILSQFVESLYAQELFADGQGYVGYLLKDRLVSIDALYDAIERIIAGGTVFDPEVVSALINARRKAKGLTQEDVEARSGLSQQYLSGLDVDCH